MALPPWTIDMLRRGIGEVARKASDPETLDKLKTQATEILQDLPETAARGINAVLRTAESGKRTVQRWTGRNKSVSIPMLNASGVLLNDFGCGVPLADCVIESGYELLRGDCVQGTEAAERLSRRVQRQVPSGDYSIAIASSFPAALTAFSLLVQQRPLVIHRNHAVRLPSGVPLPDAFGTLLPVIQEVGSVGNVDIADFDSLDSFCAIVADDGKTPVELLDFGQRDALQAVVLPVSTMKQIDEQIPSAEKLLRDGADFVLMPGDGLCGGPVCGMLIGKTQSLQVITNSTAWSALSAGESVQAMMAAALETAASNPDKLPIRALISTGEDNLRARAERMSIRLSGSDDVSSCQLSSAPAKLTAGGRWSIPSWQLRVAQTSISPQAWAGRLQAEVPAVVVDADDECIVIDFRWIAAADDNKLAGILTGESVADDSVGVDDDE